MHFKWMQPKIESIIYVRDAAASILNDVDHLEPASVQEDQHQFEAVFPDIVQDLTKTTSKYADVELANKWCEKVITIHG